MKRRLRIAVSAFFAVLCVAIIVLWVRSYHQMDNLRGPICRTRGIEFISVTGQMLVALNKRNLAALNLSAEWVLEHFDSDTGRARSDVESTAWGFVYGMWNYWTMWVPHWFLVSVFAVLTVAPWIQFTRRFSLSTLLLATAFAAIVLGRICYSIR